MLDLCLNFDENFGTLCQPGLFGEDVKYAFILLFCDKKLIYGRSDHLFQDIQVKKVKDLFQFFKEHVISDKNIPPAAVLSEFVGLVLGQSDLTLDVHTGKFAKFEREVLSLSKKNQEWLRNHMDDLYDVRQRRIRGQFYTPVKFVELVHSLMDARLGADWREQYVVWDAAAGSLNLTRGYKFKELYSSTLEQEEIDRNPVSDPKTETFFQFDFLNGDVSALSDGLRNALEMDKPILFFMNPPYSTGSKENIMFGKKTKIITNVKMQSQRMGLALSSKDLYTQFMIRIMLLVRQYKLTNVVYAVFSPLTFLTSNKLSPFRKRWCSMFQFDRGVLFDAGHFSGTAQNWAIQFSIWKRTDNEMSVWNRSGNEKTTGFKYYIIEKDAEGDIIKTGIKYVHNLDDDNPKYRKLTQDWLSSPIKEPTKFMPGVTTSFDVVNSVAKGYDTINYVSADHLGKLCYDPELTVYSTGNIYGRPGVNINTTSIGNLAVTPNNFENVSALLAVSRLLDRTFIDQRDYFYEPNTKHLEWGRFVADSVIFGLFCGGSTHISRYDIDWYGKRYQIPNEFFWMPRWYMRGLANLYENKQTLRTLDILPHERFVCGWLEQRSPLKEIVSAEALCLIKKGIYLLTTTFEHRIDFDKKHPKIQICNWDAGWWQLKELWRTVAKDDFKEFVKLRSELGDSIRSRIRLLGWLRPRER